MSKLMMMSLRTWKADSIHYPTSMDTQREVFVLCVYVRTKFETYICASLQRESCCIALVMMYLVHRHFKGVMPDKGLITAKLSNWQENQPAVVSV